MTTTTRNEAAELRDDIAFAPYDQEVAVIEKALAAAKAEGGQCDGYVGDTGASAPRCESYAGHPGRHFIRFDSSAAKAEGAREAVERIRARLVAARVAENIPASAAFNALDLIAILDEEAAR